MTEAPLREVRRAVYRPLREGNALEDTVARLVQTIRLGVVAPGESLPPERELAARYAVSRDTVREAIRELADAGYPRPPPRALRRHVRRAIRCRSPPHPGVVPLDELDDVLGLRRVLEAGAARAAAGRTLDARGARRAVGAARGGVRPRRPPTTAGSTRCCTSTIAEVAGIPSLVALAAENRARVNAWLDTFPLLPRNIEHSNAQHERDRDRDPRRASGCRRGGDPGAPRRLRGAAARLPRLTRTVGR